MLAKCVVNAKDEALRLAKFVRDAVPFGAGYTPVANRNDRGGQKRRLRVCIAASGRFHLLDLARELDQLGVEVHFYSYVPRKRAEEFGLPGRCHVALLPYVFPLVILERLFPRILPRLTESLMCRALDQLVSWKLKRCDVFVCMSGIYVRAPLEAKRRFGAKISLHRSSKHILVQRKIVSSSPGGQQVTDFMVRRELQGYAFADEIAVPSGHVAASFASSPRLYAKVFQNALGVDIEQFPFQNRRDILVKPTVIYVGHWSFRKGVDILWEAIQMLGDVRLIHVGALVDVELPNDPRMTHYDHVPQEKLCEYYGQAHVFVLASREDGFGVVIAQALSCGLSVVCSDQTGGDDLSKLPGLSRLIRVVQAGDSIGLRNALQTALDESYPSKKVAPITPTERQSLRWRHYAARELEFYQKRLIGKQDCNIDAAQYKS